MAQLSERLLQMKAHAAEVWADEGDGDMSGFDEAWRKLEPEALVRAKRELEAEAAKPPEPEPDPLTMDYASMPKAGEMRAPERELGPGEWTFDYKAMRNPAHHRFH